MTDRGVRIEIVNPADCNGWDTIIEGHRDAGFFLTSAWAVTLSASYHYKPLYFSLFQNRRLRGVIPVMEVDSILTGRRGVSLPFTDYCELIMEDKEQFNDVFSRIIAYGKERRWRYIELRGGSHFLEDEKPSRYYYGHTIELTGDEKQIFSSFRDNMQRNIQKAKKAGVTISFSHSLKSIAEFYELNCLTRKLHGLPPQPFKFFRKVHGSILSTGKGFVALAFLGERVIAGAVFFCFGVKALYKYGASDRRYQAMRANHLVMWEAIKYYSHHRYESLCLGRTDRDNHGLRQYKLGWGTEENVINYYVYDLKTHAFVKDTGRTDSLYKMIFSKMPAPLLRLSGKLLYRHVG